MHPFLRFAAATISLSVCLGPATSAEGSTIHVPADAPTIQAGIDWAAAGDTVLVACGTYYEHDIAMKSGVCLRSETGEPDCVTIDAQGQGRVISCADVDSTASIEGVTATGGSATGLSPGNRGGGVYCSESAPRVTDCDLVDNSAEFSGGGMYCHNSSAPTLTRVTFSGNTGGRYGGGLCCAGNSSPTLTSVVFSGNAAADCGGAIFCFSYASPTLTNATIYGNRAVEGGGIAAYEECSPALASSIVSFSFQGCGVHCDGTSSATLTCCDVYGNAGGDWEGCIADQYGVDGNFSADPLFCAPGSGDLQLYSVSPCVDVPGCGLIGALGVGCDPPDEPRVWYILPDSTGDAPTIQAGIDSAWAGDTVLVAAGIYHEHDVGIMKNGIRLVSESGPGATVIDAQEQGRVLLCWLVDSTATIEGFSIIGGLASGQIGGGDGGGVCCFSSSLRIVGCVFSGNSAEGHGGGLYCSGSAPTLAGCTLYGNSGLEGGGIAAYEECSLALANSIVSFSFQGCGVHCDGTSSATLTCCDVYGNAGGDWEGCIADQYGVDGNFSADPLFCAPGSGDLQLYSVSPCADAPGCGLIGALGVGCYPPDEPRVWYILPDGTGDAPTIQAGIDSAWVGDTLLVAAGTYYEHDIVMKSGIILIGESGQEATVIDAQQQGRVLICAGVDSTTSILGFTITGGLAAGVVPHNYGGGMYCSSSSVILGNCTFVANSAGFGGGFLCYAHSSPELSYCTFQGNSADADGGGLHCHTSSPTLVNCTIVDNYVGSYGGGMYCHEESSPTLENTIVAFNAHGRAVYCYGTGTATLTCCDIYGNVGGDWVGAIGPQLGVNGNIHQNPRFCDPADDDFTLQDSSPCAPFSPPNEECDLIGAWPVACVHFSYLVKPDGTGDFPTIQAAIDATTYGDVIELADGTFRGEGNRDVDYQGKAITVRSQSGDPELCVIDCEAQPENPHRAFIFHCGESEGALLEGVTVTNGYADGDPWPDDDQYGGAVLCTNGSSPTLFNCVFCGNSVAWGGGAICCISSGPTLNAVTITENTGRVAGGMWSSHSSPTLTNVVFSHNSADKGGALASGAAGASSRLTNVTMSGNSAPLGGGVFCWLGHAPPLENTIIAFSEQGAAVHVWQGSDVPSLSCCNLYGNEGGDWVDHIADQYGTDGNISEDPLFCNADDDDYHLRCCSPCEDPEGCGLVGALAVGCGARVWHVPGDAPTVQAAVDSAVFCDTVRVAAGTYVECVNVESKILVVSDSGPEVTTIRSADSGPYVISLSVPDTIAVLDGFTVDGSVAGLEKDGNRSGAHSCVYCGGEGSPLISRCILQNALVNGIECRDSANPVVGGSLEGANRILTLAGVANFTSNTIDATYNYWGRDDHGCPENNVGLVQVVPFVDSTLTHAFCDCHTLCVPEHYGAIQSAVDVALEGDTVEVAATDEVYEENVSVVGKNLTVRVGEGEGEGTPTIRSSVSPVVHLSDLDSTAVFEGFIVDASAGESAIRVDSSHVTISDSRVTGATGGGLGGSGLVMSRSRGRVVGSQMDHNETGLLVLNSSTDVVSNRVVDNERGIVCGGSPLPRIGGSLEAANDILANRTWNLENQAADSVDADFNYWGTIVYEEIAAKISGPARFCYWTDSTHTETYSCEATGVSGREAVDLPDEFYLAQNAPNPFNPATVIGFAVPAPGERVEIDIYDVRGRLVRRLVDDYRTPGIWCVRWDGKDGNGVLVSSGVYFCRMTAAGFVATRKMVLTQ